MRVVTVSRKPLVGTVARNALEWGTGGVNIDASRIGAGTERVGPGSLANPENRKGVVGSDLGFTHRDKSAFQEVQIASVDRANAMGRWPANLILSHPPGCQNLGNLRMRTSTHSVGQNKGGYSRVSVVYGQYQNNKVISHLDPDGKETVAAWDCLPSCPVKALNNQSGDQKSGVAVRHRGVGGASGTALTGMGAKAPGTPDLGCGDSGGASRFFRTIQNEGDSQMEKVSQDLIDYLITMISPPDQEALFWDGVPEDLSVYGDKTICGVLLRIHAKGQPTEAQSAELMRILMPGAHLLLIAPEDEPTGHTGACQIEDAGFEIRDAICWANQAGDGDRLHYVAKAARSEREAGCQNLRGKTVTETVNRDPDSAGVQNPRAGAGRGAGVPIYYCKNCDMNLGGGRAVSECPESPSGEHDPEERGKGNEIHNGHPCLHPEAVVMTDRGHRPIQAISLGDKVLAADGHFHSVEAVTRHPYTSECLYKISVKGTNLTTLASDNHPFLIWRPRRKGNALQGGEVIWVSADQVVKGDYTMTPVVPAGPGTKNWSEDINYWFVFGLWLAEGVSQVAGHGDNCYPSFSLHRKETYLVDRIKALTTRNVSVYDHGENGIQVMAFDPNLGSDFKRLGGSGAATKTLDPVVWSLGEPQRRAMVEGYLAGDGGVVRTYIQAKSVSTDLATQMTFLAGSLGYKTNLFWFKAAPGKIGSRHFKTTSPYYQMQFYSRDLNQTSRKPASPTQINYEGAVYTLRYVQGVEKVPYVGDVWNLSVEGNHTFQTAVGMSHNTVKPIDLMERLLVDVPKDQGPVLDPFHGSGTTGIACLKTGHDFIGIEREAEYLEIEDARLRHWRDKLLKGDRWEEVTILSDYDPPVEAEEVAPAKPKSSIEDMFGW